MPLIEDELRITPIKELINLNLALPPYQRPYRWTVKSTNTLFMDTYEAFKDGIEEYRLGSIILHKEPDNTYNIVDGQQRLTTLSILLHCLDYNNNRLLNEKYNQLSNKGIVDNHNVLSRRVKELENNELTRFRDYLLENCTTVKIVTDNEQEAFQFFDSQNSRGKELAPHDLLKSYHLREMNEDAESNKVKIINRWENVNQDDLDILFKNYLFPVTQWVKQRDGLGYSSSKIDTFKGIKRSDTYHYSIYHKASNLFVEQYNANGNNELLATASLNQFQLTQPIIAGKRFFSYTLHYGKLLEFVQKEIDRRYDANQVPSKRFGDIYVKQLFECALLVFVDRFGKDCLSKSVMEWFYSWCYSLRLMMYAVYPQTINKYAIGEHDRVNKKVDIFSSISEMSDPNELQQVVLNRITVDQRFIVKYQAVYQLLDTMGVIAHE